MIADLKPYAQYKETGSPWLGKIPTHWNVVRLGSVLRERRATNEDRQVTQVLSVLKDVGVIRYEDKGNIGNKKSEDIRRYKIVRPDDLVVNCMNVIIGSVGRSHYTGCLSPVYYVLTRRSEGDNPRYLAAIFAAKPFHESLVRIGNGILAHRMRIPMELLKCEPFPLPPPAEQAAIMRFLDWANGRLERVIQAKRRVIALLKEQKQAIIHRAVTRGLDPSAPLKPSGIPWLGDIPQHWEVRKVREVATVVNGYPFNSRLFSLDRGHPLIRIRDLNSSETAVRYRGVWVEAARVRPGDVLIGMDGDFNVGTWNGEEDALLNQRMCCVRSTSKTMSEYLLYALSRPLRELNDVTYATTVKHLASSQVERISVAVAPDPELEALVGAMRDRCHAFGKGIARLEREIELLREYRTRLVTDVVTGKLDERDAAARVPDEALLDSLEDDTDVSDEPEAAEEVAK